MNYVVGTCLVQINMYQHVSMPTLGSVRQDQTNEHEHVSHETLRHAKSIASYMDQMKKLYQEMEDLQKETAVTRSTRLQESVWIYNMSTCFCSCFSLFR